MTTTKTIKEPKLTKEEKELHMRGECLGVVVSVSGRAPNARWADLLNAAEMVYQWMTKGDVPGNELKHGDDVVLPFRLSGVEDDHG